MFEVADGTDRSQVERVHSELLIEFVMQEVLHLRLLSSGDWKMDQQDFESFAAVGQLVGLGRGLLAERMVGAGTLAADGKLVVVGIFVVVGQSVLVEIVAVVGKIVGMFVVVGKLVVVGKTAVGRFVEFVES